MINFFGHSSITPIGSDSPVESGEKELALEMIRMMMVAEMRADIFLKNPESEEEDDMTW